VKEAIRFAVGQTSLGAILVGPSKKGVVITGRPGAIATEYPAGMNLSVRQHETWRRRAKTCSGIHCH